MGPGAARTRVLAVPMYWVELVISQRKLQRGLPRATVAVRVPVPSPVAVAIGVPVKVTSAVPVPDAVLVPVRVTVVPVRVAVLRGLRFPARSRYQTAKL